MCLGFVFGCARVQIYLQRENGDFTSIKRSAQKPPYRQQKNLGVTEVFGAASFCSHFMACLEGFEPPTYWFVASHSIQLSYRHTFPTLIIISQIFMYVNVFFVLRTKLCKILKKIHIISTLVAYMYIFSSSKNFP